MAKILIVLGVALVIIGLIWHFFPGFLNWFGRLPGDIRIEGESGGFFFPITTMIIVSVVLSIILNLFQR